MKTLEDLYNELQQKIRTEDLESSTYRLFSQGKHAIGKKLVEEACESWMAAEHEGPERIAEELSQILYYVLVMMLACDLTLEDIYRTL